MSHDLQAVWDRDKRRRENHRQTVYYLNKAMKYTDFKMVPVGGHNTYDTAATYYGMRVLMPKEDDEKVDYFEEITGKIYDAIGKKK